MSDKDGMAAFVVMPCFERERVGLENEGGVVALSSRHASERLSKELGS